MIPHPACTMEADAHAISEVTADYVEEKFQESVVEQTKNVEIRNVNTITVPRCHQT